MREGGRQRRGEGEREGPVSMPLPVMRCDLTRCHCFLHLQPRQERVYAAVNIDKFFFFPKIGKC